MHCHFLPGLYSNLKHANLIIVEEDLVGFRSSSHFRHVLCKNR